MKSTEIPYVDDKKQYVDCGQVPEDVPTSRSGKAVLVSNPKHLGDFWCPSKLIRRQRPQPGQEMFGESLLVPVWFLARNGIPY